MWDEKNQKAAEPFILSPPPIKKGWQRPNVIVSGIEIGAGDREKSAEKFGGVLRAMEVGEGS